MTLTDQLAAALREVNKIIADAGMAGCNYKYGDWAERLIASQGPTSQALAAYEARPAASDDVEARFDRSTQVALVAEALLKGFWFSDEKQAVRAARAAIAAMGE